MNPGILVRRSLPFLCILGLALGLTGGALACIPGGEREQLHYRVAYQGVLSLGERLEIARVTLTLEPWQGAKDAPLLRSSLTASTEGFPRVEAIYPFRFAYRSWFAPDCAATRMVELKRRSPEETHQLLWFDSDPGVVQRFKQKKGKKTAALPPLLRSAAAVGEQPFSPAGETRFPPGQGILDRLAMLYRLRGLELHPGKSLQFAVSDGKKLRGYRVTPETKEAAKGDPLIAGSLRLRLEPQGGEEGEEEPATYVWLSDDSARIPLRFLSRRSYGDFELRLAPAATLARP